jgi:cysteine desulfurase
MLPWWRFGGAGNPHSHEHAFGWRAAQAIDGARAQLAELIGADDQDLIFTSGATESNNLAIVGTMRAGRSLRHTVLVTAIDHASVIGPAAMLEDEGFRCVTLPVDAQGRLLREAFLSQLTDDVLLVSVGAANNEVGTLQDLPWIAERCHEAGAFVHADAAQALTAAPLSVREWGIDLGSFSAHKAYGPQGIGALYVAPGMRSRLRATSQGGGQQSGLRPGTLPTALCVGFGMAGEILGRQGALERQRVEGQRDRLIASLLLAFPDASINGPLTNRHPGNVNLRIPGIDATDLIQRLQPNVALSSGSACHSGSDQPSHVLLAMGLSNPEARESVRLGIGRFTTDADIITAVEMIVAAIRESRAAFRPRTAVGR